MVLRSPSSGSPSGTRKQKLVRARCKFERAFLDAGVVSGAYVSLDARVNMKPSQHDLGNAHASTLIVFSSYSHSNQVYSRSKLV